MSRCRRWTGRCASGWPLTLRHVLTETGTTAMMVTHDHGDAFTVADRTAIMRAGRLVQQGETAEVWAHPVDADTAHFLGVSVPSDLAEP
jgi:thiamine transport system ATP-binding protein